MITQYFSHRKTTTTLAAALVLASLLVGFTPARAQDAAALVCMQYHTVQRGENLFRIGQRYGVTTAALQSWNSIRDANRIYAGQSLCVAMTVVQQPKTHVVQAGETLTRIARRYGVDLYVLAQVNNITNLNRIYVGQALRIPDVTIQ